MLKKLLFIFTLLFAVFQAPASAEYFTIQNYNVEVRLNKDAVLTVHETIRVNFTSPRRGIFRKIPYSYSLQNRDEASADRPVFIGSRYKIKIYDIEVPGRNFTTYNQNNMKFIRIGDKSRYVSGTQEYSISYKVFGGVNFFDDKSELYWNFVGVDWPVAIDNVDFTLIMPGGYNPDAKDVAIYTGGYGETGQDAAYRKTDGLIQGSTTRPLRAGEGVTIAVAFPDGFLKNGTLGLKASLFLINNAGLVWVVLLLIVLFAVWFRFGRDEHRAGMVYFKPPGGLTPAEAGVLIDDKLDNRDLISLIFYWAAGGYMEIEETEDGFAIFKSKDYIFTKVKDLPEDAKPYEKTIFYGIFPAGMKNRRLSDLKDKFYTTMKEARSQLDSEIRAKSFYAAGTRALGKLYYLLGVVSVVGGMFMFVSMQDSQYVVAGIASAVLFFIFGRIMPKKSADGMKDYHAVQGFKMFIDRAEVPKLKVLMHKDESYFDKTLPYAVALGSVKKWGEKFDGLLSEPPRWYRSHHHGHFSAAAFTAGLSGGISNMNKAMTSSPSSSGSGGSGGSGFGGGGFSGGGMGGGGGGSW